VSLIDRNLNDIVAFVQVVDSGTFTAAAKRLRMPVSTVSRKVARLEASLEVQLLRRTTRSLSLTEAGREYYERSVAALSSLEEAENVLAETRASPRGRVHLAAPVEHSVTMRLVASFLRRYPDVRVDIDFTARAVNILDEGFDASIHVGPPVNLSTVARKLMDSPFKVVASPDYLAVRGTPRNVQELVKHDFVVFGASSAQPSVSLMAGGQAVPVKVGSRIAVNHMGAVRDAVSSGLGIGVLPVLGIDAELASGALVAILDGAEPPAVPLYVTYAAGGLLPPAVRVFVDHVLSNFSSEAKIHPTSHD